MTIVAIGQPNGGNLEPSEYKHVALGLIFLKYISEASEAQHTKLQGDDFDDMR